MWFRYIRVVIAEKCDRARDWSRGGIPTRADETRSQQFRHHQPWQRSAQHSVQLSAIHDQHRQQLRRSLRLPKRHALRTSSKLYFLKFTPRNTASSHQAFSINSTVIFAPQAFSINGRDTITTRRSEFQNVIGNAQGLSFRDIKLANLMYNCNGSFYSKSQSNVYSS